ncbi:MAG: methyltransferase domain-containing protein [Gammaproteobacteria bacterium]|nr:methyltransferase domain-containing protein [Gammaproteobacteria bacterium]
MKNRNSRSAKFENTKQALELILHWQSAFASHTDRMLFAANYPARINLPGDLHTCLDNASFGETVFASFPSGSLIEYYPNQFIQLPYACIQPIGNTGIRVEPRQGRFYPRCIIAGSLGIDHHDRQPMRIIDTNASSFTVDLNHPLANLAIEVGVRLMPLTDNPQTTLNESTEPLNTALATGIGLQKMLDQSPDFYDQDMFTRQDSSNDAIFYRQKRMVHHIDQSASDTITQIYRRELLPQMRVLDLMSSWQSHLPNDITDLHITGLGMNDSELLANPDLDDYVVHDLNQQPSLPFSNDFFDLTLCSLSIEYLVDPLSVLHEVIRVTRPGGKLLVSFSNRSFQSKAITIWHELHLFERLGLVLDLMLRTRGLIDLTTETLQGQPRAANDIYSGKLMSGDPVFVVSATVNR